MSRQLVWLMFILLLVGMILVYNKGAATAWLSFTSGLRSVIYGLTGRDNNGAYVPYASGA